MEFPIDLPQEYGWATVAVVALVSLMTAFARWWKRRDEKDEYVEDLMKQRAQALREGRITDAAALNAQIRRLLTFIASCAILVSVAGCKTTDGNGPVVIGERVYLPKPGEVVTVPPLIEPAGQWYLIDDVALDRMGFHPVK